MILSIKEPDLFIAIPDCFQMSLKHDSLILKDTNNYTLIVLVISGGGASDM